MAARIVTTARAHFAEHGFAGTTLRAVARDAGVDSALIHYYFTDKSALLEACLVPPPGFLEGIAAAAAVPLPERGAAFARRLVGAWEDPASAPVLRSMVLTAAHDPVARERVRGVMADGILPAVADHLEPEQALLRAGLAATQLIGLAMVRYVWRLAPVCDLPADEVVALVGPSVQRYLDGP